MPSSAIDRARARRRVQGLKQKRAATPASPAPSVEASPAPEVTKSSKLPLWARLALLFAEPHLDSLIRVVLRELRDEVLELEGLTDDERALLEAAMPVIGQRIASEIRERIK